MVYDFTEGIVQEFENYIFYNSFLHFPQKIKVGKQDEYICHKPYKKQV